MRVALLVFLTLLFATTARAAELPDQVRAIATKVAEAGISEEHIDAAALAFIAVGDDDKARRLAVRLPLESADRAYIIAALGDVDAAYRLAAIVRTFESIAGRDFFTQDDFILERALFTAAERRDDDRLRALLARPEVAGDDASFDWAYPFFRVLDEPAVPSESEPSLDHAYAADLLAIRGRREDALREADLAEAILSQDANADAPMTAVFLLDTYHLLGDADRMKALERWLVDGFQPERQVASLYLMQASAARRAGDDKAAATAEALLAQLDLTDIDLATTRGQVDAWSPAAIEAAVADPASLDAAYLRSLTHAMMDRHRVETARRAVK